jgi:hypothetical protein
MNHLTSYGMGELQIGTSVHAYIDVESKERVLT